MTEPRFPVQGQEVVPPSPTSGAGQYNPYRGLDVHGVASPDVWQDVAAPDTATAKVSTYEEPPEPDPVPVRIVQEEGRERITLFTHWEYVDSTHAVRIAGRNDRRKTMKVRVGFAGGGTFWIVNSESGTKQFGYVVPEGTEFTTTSQDDVWAVHDSAPSNAQVVITVAEDISEGLG